MNVKQCIRRIKFRVLRNRFSLGGKKSQTKRVNLEWWGNCVNLGDYLAHVVYDWMLECGNCDKNKVMKKTTHLMTIGSVVGMAGFDAVIWGSGIHRIETANAVFLHKKYAKYDVRALRGPITQDILKSCGYQCDCVLGDPAVLMPLIYQGKICEKKYKLSIVRHINTEDVPELEGMHYISIRTKDYEKFIDELLESECIISSSLHGIILAESYGVPAIFWNDRMDHELMKYYDWYYATNRMNVKVAKSLEEAIHMTPMELPQLDNMRKELMSCFPYDLWK